MDVHHAFATDDHNIDTEICKKNIFNKVKKKHS